MYIHIYIDRKKERGDLLIYCLIVFCLRLCRIEAFKLSRTQSFVHMWVHTYMSTPLQHAAV